MPTIVPNKPLAGSKIFLVGETPGGDEVLRLRPFVGASGEELNRMLNEAGILRSECSVGNVCQYQPPNNLIEHFIDPRKTLAIKKGLTYHPPWRTFVQPFVLQHMKRLEEQILDIEPNLIIALGNTPLTALTGERGISNWRASVLETASLRRRSDGKPFKVIPCYHPAYILRCWYDRFVAVQDFRRCCKEALFPEVRTPAYNFVISPSFEQAMSWMDDLLNKLDWCQGGEKLRVSVDIETKARQITCIGLGTSELDAICIPFIDFRKPGANYWPTKEEELAIVFRLRTILTRPSIQLVGQNFTYDDQYLARQWGFLANIHSDTMLDHHTNFTKLEKGLDFLSSIYCKFHRFWKGESKEWDTKHFGHEELWGYNCKDCVITWEVSQALDKVSKAQGQEPQVAFENSLRKPVLSMMLRGTKIDVAQKAELTKELAGKEEQLQLRLNLLAGHYLNPKSTKVMDFMYKDMRQPEVLNRKTKRPTADDDALDKIAKREPLLAPVCKTITKMRSLGVFRANFLEAGTEGGRMRCNYNIAGTSTFRFSSSQDAFGSGTNLQNIPSGDEESDLPNIRKLFVPDDGYVLMDWDLDRADLQVVAWECEDAVLKQMLREGVDLHSENAKIVGLSRQVAKVFCHGSNYGGRPRTMAINCGITTHQAELGQRRWFGAHPGIHAWHRRTEQQLASRRFVQNAFGFRCFFFDRPDAVLSEALAWVPQSTVAIVINTGMLRIYNELPLIELLLQVHDSLVMQTLTEHYLAMLPQIRKCLLVTVPYADPLVIPISCKASTKSWGDCEKVVLTA